MDPDGMRMDVDGNLFIALNASVLISVLFGAGDRRRNRCPCGECFVRPEFNTPGECSFHVTAAVAVGAATTVTTIASGESSHQRLHQPLPHHLRQNRDDYDKSGGCRFQRSVEADLLLLWERKCYGKGRAEALLQGAAAGVRERAPNDYFRGSGSSTEGAGDSATVYSHKYPPSTRKLIILSPPFLPAWSLAVVAAVGLLCPGVRDVVFDLCTHVEPS